ncbi:MAG: flagellar export protein FliJ [Gallionellales bacterium RBG_16_57_15]|nr:MAG: flagellar export protein FliJ [Gallionellales bacterium RBG_16_57_15]
MTKPFSLQPLMNLSMQQNETATRKLGQLNRQQLDAQSKLDILKQYRLDYQTRMQESTRNGMDPAELRNFQEFINKLDAAIDQQEKAVKHSKTSTQAGRSEFDATRRKLKSFDTLQQRHIQEQRKIAEKSEQKDQDEHTSKLAAYKKHDAETQNN